MATRELNRRRFLRMAGAGALAAPALGTATAEAQSVQPQVIIIGAGMSGISAAYWLRQYGIRSIVLEGRSRLGGRLFSSTYWPDATLDLGGAWIHDAPNSPLTPIANAAPRIVTQETDFASASLSTQDGYKLSPLELGGVFLSYAVLFEKVNLVRAQRQLLGLPDQKLSNPVESILPTLQLDPLTAGGVQTSVIIFRNAHSGAELKEESHYFYDGDQNVTGNHDRAFPGGYVQLVERLRGTQTVLFDHPIKRIQYTTRGVTVTTDQGTTFSAPYALITVPVGVLKSQQIEFLPQLPPSKRDAITRLGMGVVEKIALRFPYVFWETGDDPKNPINFLGRFPSEDDRFSFWFNARPLTGKPILVVLISADFAKQINGLSTDEVKRRMTAILRRWYGPGTPDPIDIQRSDWGTNRFSLGSYSYYGVGSTLLDRDLLAQPVHAPGTRPGMEQVFFAGEATDRAHPGSVWGAYVAGKREAERIWRQVRSA